MSQPDKIRKSNALPVNRAISRPAADAMSAVPKRESPEHAKKQTRTRVRKPAPLPQELPLSSATPEPETSSPSVAASLIHAVSDIPSLGPIRVRALEKAGLGSLAVLRAATREQLLAVPGMSTIKAEHIQTFLASAAFAGSEEVSVGSEAETADKPTKPSRSARRSLNVLASRRSEIAPSAPLSLTAPVAVWDKESASVRADVITLLVSPPAPDFRARLLRELVRFAAGMPVWQKGLAEVGEKAQERALRRVRRLQEALTEALVQDDLDRKTQSRLAEELADASDRLYALSGQTEPVRKGEEGHD